MQEDQKVAWLQDDPHCMLEMEKKCQQKDTLISQLYHQLGILQQQQQQQYGSDTTRLMYPVTDMANSDVGQKLAQLEREVAAKHLEVEEFRAKVCVLCIM